tara:strand:+ start:17938 stop:18429 length:492 start_codon:yes stop_codon:yes gene_type:complete
MSDNLINLMDKRISNTEKKLEELKQSRDALIKSTKSKGLKPMRFEICKTPDGWNLTFPSGNETNNLPSLSVCLLIIKPHYQKCQFRNQSFELYDHNTNTLFQDYRVFTEWVEKADGEVVDQTPKIEEAQEKMEKKIKNSRIPRNNKVQSKVKKIDQRIFDRTY